MRLNINFAKLYILVYLNCFTLNGGITDSDVLKKTILRSAWQFIFNLPGNTEE